MIAEKTESLDLHYFEQNLVFLSNGVKAVYTYQMAPYPYMSEDRQKAIIQALDDFFFTYRGKGKMLLLNRLLTPEEVLQELDQLQQENMFPKTYAKWKKEMKIELEKRRPWTQVLYLILDLPKKATSTNKVDITKSISKGGGKQLLKDLYKQTMQDIYQKISASGLAAIGLANKDIPEEEIQQALNDERTMFSAWRQAGGLSKATPQDIQFILRAPFYRGVSTVPIMNREKPPVARVKKDDSVYLRPNKSYIMDIFDDAYILPEMKYVTVHHGEPYEEGKTSYQTNMVLTDLPDHIQPRGNEWLFWLNNSFHFPVDICINFEVKDPVAESKRLRSKQHDAEGNMETQDEHGIKTSQKEVKNLSKAEELEQKLDEGYPLMEMETILCVSDTTKEGMEDRVNSIQSVFDPRKISFSVVPSKAVHSFLKFFPWSQMDEYWTFPCDTGYISAGAPHATAELGTESGPLIAFTWNDKPILADLGWPMRNNKPGTIILLGSMGGGKSATMKKLIKIILLLGGYVFCIDPKDEFHVFMQNEELAKYTKVIKFGAGMDSTKLNIFTTSKNRDRAWQVAKDNLILMFNARGDDKEKRSLVINKVLKKTMLHGKPTMMKFVKDLEDYHAEEQDAERRHEASIMLDLCEGYMEDPLAKIIFNDEEDAEDLNLEDYRLVIANFKGLRLPKKGMDISTMSDTEKISLCIVHLTGFLGRELMQHRSNEVLKAYAADEYWLLESDELQSLNKELVKMSRSQYVVPIFATQEAGDIKSPDVRNNIGWVFVGKSESEDEIKDACMMMGIKDPSDDVKNQIQGLESGQFFVRDPLGRRDIVQIYQPEEWLEMFKTTPTPKKKVS